MKKRLLSIFIVILLLIPTSVLTGCQKKDNIVRLTGTDANPLTVTLYSIIGEETTDEALQAVEDKINSITEYEFNTHVILRFLTEDEYNETVEKDLIQAKESVNAEPKVTKKEETTEFEYETDEDGETEHVIIQQAQAEYPEENGTQVDILLINSLDMYNNCVKNEQIQDLSGLLLPGADSAILTKYINTTLMKSMTVANPAFATYAIPNNRVVGEYEYLLLNKALVDKYGHDPESIKTLSDIEAYVSSVSAETGYIPVLDTYGVEPLIETVGGYFGAYVGYDMGSDEQFFPDDLLLDKDYQKELGILNAYKAAGTLKQVEEEEFTDETKAACVFLQGDAKTPEKYADDYYVSVYKKPTATNENVFNSVYAVSSYTKDVTRCMEIINYMQTNQEFINVLRYGVEGKHFTKDDNNFVTVLNDDYDIDPAYAGNMFLQYQNNKMTETELNLSKDNWALAKEQNLGIISGPYLGFSGATTDIGVYTFKFDSDMNESDFTAADIMEQIEKLSEEYAEDIEGLTGTALTEKMEELGKKFDKDKKIKIALKNNYRESPFAKYLQWFTNNHPEETAE